MKIISSLSGLVFVLLTLTATAREIPQVTPAEAGLSETKLAEVDQFMQKAVADQKIAGGVVIISHEGKIGFFHAYGLMDREAKKPMSPDTIFRIYSMSKAITTAAALTLYDAGKLGLDDPVSKYIPAFTNAMVATTNGLRAPARAVTIRDLMLHTSGLTYGDGLEALKKTYAQLKPLESTNLVEMTGKLSQVPLAFDPGTDWTYGTGIDVLGRVIEVISGKDLNEFLAETIFQPLDMSDTGFSVPSEKLGRFAANYTRTNATLKVIDAPAESKYAKPATLFSGGGGLVSTARDYLRFLAMIERGGTLDGHRILRDQTVKLMTSNQLPPAAFPIYFGKEKHHGTGYGLGFSVRTQITDWDPAGHAGEYGWGGAASTHYWSSPADKLIVVTFEQIMPYESDTEFGTKKIIYDAIVK
ncbi:MAG TPA: serine hydrolase domain-containing protein [Verrucomicrobiae bacterium]|nr:serine hydrolase domain-containing protein [Verrucomicrobiae bacterium]